MDKTILGKGIKGILVIDTEGRILDKVKLSKNTSPDYQYPILTTESFCHLADTESKPFDILKIVIDKGEITDATVVAGITRIPKEKRDPVIEFTLVDHPVNEAKVLKLWHDYITLPKDALN